ncbi:MAG: hypothetical protein J6C86_03870 [Bacteroidaceae bacterium]|nr:hypothetical protein [Bacteroidaceae bacterium]
MKKSIIISAVIACAAQNVVAQNNNPFRQKYEQFKSNAEREYVEFRRKCNEDYANFMRQAWKTYKGEEPIKIPEEKKIPVKTFPEKDKDKPIETKPVTIKNIIKKTDPIEQPQPICVIPEEPPFIPYIDKGILRPKNEINAHLDSIKSLLALLKPQNIPLDTLNHDDLIDILPQLDYSIRGVGDDKSKSSIDTIKALIAVLTPQNIPLDTLDHRDLIDILPFIEDGLRKNAGKDLKMQLKGIKALQAILTIPETLPEIPVEEPEYEFIKFNFYGGTHKVRLGEENRFTLRDCKEKTVADAWMKLSRTRFSNTLKDCLALRDAGQLCDWAYLNMLKAISDTFCGEGTNESTLMTAYIYTQSGYKMRLASSNNKLYLLFASNALMYDRSYYIIGKEHFYIFDGDANSVSIFGELAVFDKPFQKESPMTMLITKEQKFKMAATDTRTIVSQRYPDIKVETKSNKNLIDFYDAYPPFAQSSDDLMTRWSIYANTPLSTQSVEMIYPVLKEKIKGKTQLDAVNRLLNFVQTGFVYEYDDVVWGHDRAFFADETLYYPYCDCEDRSILFSRLVRDLLGMKVLLVYYPGHLATAVHFDEDVNGDYITLENTKYTVCDPTFIGAAVGRTMPNMDNSGATVILLE